MYPQTLSTHSKLFHFYPLTVLIGLQTCLNKFDALNPMADIGIADFKRVAVLLLSKAFINSRYTLANAS